MFSIAHTRGILDRQMAYCRQANRGKERMHAHTHRHMEEKNRHDVCYLQE